MGANTGSGEEEIIKRSTKLTTDPNVGGMVEKKGNS
jgi:hypothetical protein